VRKVLRLAAYSKNPNIGVYVGANDRVAVLPPGAPKSFVEVASETLAVEVVESTVGGTSLLGVMMALNNHGTVVPRHCPSLEVENLKKAGLTVGVIPDKYTALGNLVLLNDKGAIASEVLSKRAVKIMEDALGCEVYLKNLGGHKIVGSLGVATNKGALLYPNLEDEELDWAEEVLKVDVDIGTVNQGVGYVKTGLVANTKGALIGNATTGPEIARIEDSLGFL
jgi:translation initiation factor 6